MVKDWNEIQLYSESSDSTKKELFKQGYDYSDVNDKYHKYMDERE